MATIFSFFSGSGFLDLGFEHSGFKIAMVNEFHEPFLEAYKYSRKHLKLKEPEYGYYLNSIEDFVGNGKLAPELKNNVRTSQNNGELVGFIGGPPCPDFSIGGKNKGHEGDNGRLTETYVDCVIQHKPDFFLFENVKGLWRTVRHRKFYEEMKNKLQNEGYILTENLINCIQYGAPQDRDRILLFGIKKHHVINILNEKSLKSMLIDEDFFNWNKRTKFTREESLSNNDWPEKEPFVVDSIKPKPKGVKAELTIEHWFKKNKVHKHINASHYFRPKSARFTQVEEGDTSKKSFKRLHRWRYSPTAAYGNNEVHLHPYQARRLSVSEALAIQSLPADFVLPPTMTLSNMFKTIGNGVPYLAGLGVAKTIDDFLILLKKR
ncbi:DNA cytosine methyltransferase [Marinomonas sp. TW1]|uniref:DNA cytosine methyltransferase n=1 Tax=Marinomonas sp. TW1 TaxID=1561203 RepID=UPI0007AF6F57|nr:DNA cytosine methyltransferase [Marinomonas sp. TW1]KZN13940.1 hypothetical protein OA79_07555 [Marinomonas sp. TW1]